MKQTPSLGVLVALTLMGCSNKAPVTCLVGLTTCQSPDGGSDICVDTQNDPHNCGGCAQDCGDGGACALSSCVPAGCGAACGCSPFESRCGVDSHEGVDAGTYCTNLGKDPANCGACGLHCDGGDVCAGGYCLGSCPAQTTPCSPDGGTTFCAYLPRDPFNCGQCGLACSGGLGSCLLGGCFGVVPPDLPDPSWSLAAAVDLDGGVYAIGGSDSYGRAYAAVWRFTGTDAGWVLVQPLATARASLAAATGRDGRIYALGGAVGYSASGAAEVFDPVVGQWSTLPSMPTPRVWLAAAASADGRIYTLGGQLYALSTLPDGGIGTTFSASGAVEIYDPATGQWSSGPSLPTARWGLAAVLGPDGNIYAMGGQTDGITPTDVVERLLPDGGWEAVAPLSSGRSGLAAAVSPDGQIYAISGYIQGGPVVGTVDVLDVTKGTWSAGAELPTPRYGLAAATAAGSNGYIFAIGGGVPGPLSAVLPTVEVLVVQYQQWQ